MRASANLFEVLGVAPALGRGFLPEEETSGRDRVVVLSHAFWRTRLGGDPGAIGRTITLDGAPHEIVGVMPADFRFPNDASVALWNPLAFDASEQISRAERRWNVIARLAPGATESDAATELGLLAARMSEKYPETNAGWSVATSPAGVAAAAGGRSAVVLLVGTVALVLLLACANVGHLFLARALDRERELAVRVALGGAPARLLRLLTLECAVVVAVGAAAGVALAGWAVPLIQSSDPGLLPGWRAATLDWRVLGFTLALLVPVVFLCGVLPAVRAVGLDRRVSLTGSGARLTSGPDHGRLRRGLIVAEVALSVVLLIAAGLHLRSLVRLQAVDPGFDAEHVLAATVFLGGPRYTSDAQQMGFFTQAVERIGARPGVTAAGAVTTLPMNPVGIDYDLPFSADGNPPPATADRQEVDFRVVEGDYFRALGVPVVRGRAFAVSDREDAPRVVMVNRTLATRFFGGENPVGRRVWVGGHFGAATVVGLVGDVRHRSLAARPKAELYVPFRQYPHGGMTIVVRASGRCRQPRPHGQGRALRDRPDAADQRPLDAARSAGGLGLTPALHSIPARWIRRARLGAGRGRRLRCHRLFGRPADPRDRHPHRPRGRRPRDPTRRGSARPAARRRGRRARLGCRRPAGTRAQARALRSQPIRSAHLRVRRGRPARRGVGGVRHPGASGRPRRPAGRAEVRMIEWLRRDLRYGVRQLLRSPGFAVAAVLTLALGVGANTIMFSMVNGLLLRPLPVASPDRVVALYATDLRKGNAGNLSYPEYVDYRDRSGVFAGLVAQQGVPVSLSTAEGAEMVWSEIVTENYFSTLGLRPAVGRTFLPADAAGPGADPLAVLSHRLWRYRFGGDVSVIGRVIRLNGHPFTVVGVAPPGYTGLRKFGFHPDVWVPMMMHGQIMAGSDGILDDRENSWLTVAGRLGSGIEFAGAEARLASFASGLERTYPGTYRNRGIRLLPGGSGFDDPDFAPPRVLALSAALAMGASGLILLLACTNVANLLLARASGRGREVGIRLALGASRAGLVRQFLTEGLLLAMLGGAAGTALAAWTGEIQEVIVPRLQFPVGFDVTLDRRVLAFGLIVSLLTSLLFGLAPGLRAARQDVVTMLKSQEMRSRTPRWGLDLRSILVIAQVALSLVLLIGGGLFLRSLLNARTVDVGLARENRMLLSLDPGLQGYDSTRVAALYRELIRRVERLPGVTSATLGFPIPLDTYGRTRTLYPDRPGDATTEGLDVAMTVASTDYFETVGAALLRGRAFEAGDSSGTDAVVVVNQTLAARLAPGGDAIGRQVRLGAADGPRVRIIGVARDGRYGHLGEAPRPYMYLPLAQHPRSWLTLIVRTKVDPAGAIPAVRGVVRELDPDLAAFGVMTMDRHLDNALNLPSISATFASAFGAIALLLATVGIYGLVSYSVARRTREVGIRLALGATGSDVMRLVLRRGLIQAATGVGAGLGVAYGATRLIGGFLYDVSPTDPVIYVSMSLLLAAVVLLASYMPARRAMRVDPVASLRSE